MASIALDMFWLISLWLIADAVFDEINDNEEE